MPLPPLNAAEMRRETSDLKSTQDFGSNESRPNYPFLIRQIVEKIEGISDDDLVREIVKEIQTGKIVIEAKGEDLKNKLTEMIQTKIAFKQSMEESRN